MNLLTGSLAAFYLWSIVRFFLPFIIPDRIAVLLFAGISYVTVVTLWSLPRMVLAVAGATVLLARVFSLLTGPEAPGPWDWRAFVPRLPRRQRVTGTGHVPGEAPSRVGRRLPRI